MPMGNDPASVFPSPFPYYSDSVYTMNNIHEYER